MQTDYLFHGLKGYSYIKRFSYLFEMEHKEANERYKIIQFYDKYGLEATIEAFNISRRTIFRWKAKLKANQNEIVSLNPKSTQPKHKRVPLTSKSIIDEIKRLREQYPNMGKAKLYYLLQPWCEDNNLEVPSESTIGRIISRDTNKMRVIPYNIDRNGKIKLKKRDFKTRKPKGLQTNPMHLWAVVTTKFSPSFDLSY